MSKKIRPVGVSVKAVPDLWPFIKGWIEKGKPDHADMTDILRDILARDKQLWTLHDDEGIVGACVTQLTIDKDSDGPVCWIYAFGGNGVLDSAKFLLFVLEHWSKEKQATAIRLRGRPGWFRIFPELEIKQSPSGFTYLEKLI